MLYISISLYFLLCSYFDSKYLIYKMPHSDPGGCVAVTVYTAEWLKKKRLPSGWWQVVERELTNGTEVTRLVRDEDQEEV
jgi:hypothetical protein